MDIKVLMMVFWTVLLAELGDMTQVAILLFAVNRDVHTMSVFAGAAPRVTCM